MLNDAEDSGNPDHVALLLPFTSSMQKRRQQEQRWNGLVQAGFKPDHLPDPDDALLMKSYLSAQHKNGYQREVDRLHKAMMGAQGQPAAPVQGVQP
jgi:hypothetical protein